MRMEERLARKQRGLEMLRTGAAGKEVATALGVDEGTVSRWKRDLVAGVAAPVAAAADARPPVVAAVPERRPKARRATVSFYLPLTLVTRLDALAAAGDTPVSTVVERLLEGALAAAENRR